MEALGAILDKIHSSHPSIRPRMNTPTIGRAPPIGPKKPAPSPLSAKKPAPPPVPTEQELYIECEQDKPVEDYLEFEPGAGGDKPQGGGDIPQDVYEEMNTKEDGQDEFYEEPGG